MANVLDGTTYIITFQLGTGANKAEIERILGAYAAWGRITDSTWAIVSTSDKAKGIRDRLAPYIGVDGRLFVVKSGYESAWRNTAAKNEWLQKHLAN